MKRVLIALITALPLVVGVASAQAEDGGFPMTGQAAVAGSVVSVDPATGTFVANAYVVTPPAMGVGDDGGGSSDGGTSGSGPSGPLGGSGGFPGFGGDVVRHTISAPTPPTTTQVTISTDANTDIHVGGVDGPATITDIAPGDRFFALFPGASTDTIQTLVANPATSVFAQVPKQFYAFVGTVTQTDTTANTVTVNVTRTLPSSLIAGGTSATFTVDSNTMIIGGTSAGLGSGGDPFGGLFGGSLTDVSVGDMVAGGLIGDAGFTATQVESMPLMFLLDLPAPTAGTGTGTSPTTAARNALKETLKVLHGAKLKVHAKKSHHRKSHHSAKKSKHAGRR